MKSIRFSTSIDSEYAIALDRVGWAELDIGVIKIAGRDRSSWLHKLITADVEHLAAGQGTHAGLLDPKGHFIADFVALAQEDSILLMAEPGAMDLLVSSLRRYIIREKVQLSNESAAWRLFALVGAESDRIAEESFHRRAPATFYHFTRAELDGGDVQLIRSMRARVPGTDLLLPSSMRQRVLSVLATIPEFSMELMEVLRIEAGLPRWGIDFDSTTLALEIPSILSVRVDQGCYVGQEVVARLVHRGHVNRSLMGLRLEGMDLPPRGALLFYQNKEVGSITSTALSPRFGGIGLGYVRREVSEPGTWLQVGDHLRAQVATLPFEE